MAHLLTGVAIAATVLSHLSLRRHEQVVRWWSTRVLRILNVRLQILGEAPSEQTRGVMFVANHISWLDIWTINAVRAVRFVSKSEVRSWPIIGWLAAKSGTIFIERARRHDTSRVSGAVADALRNGDCVCVFPEGTTTDGTHMRPFKSSLLQSAVDANAAIWPVVVSYLGRDGEPDISVAYADDISLVQSLRQILSQEVINVRLDFLPTIEVAGKTRRELTQQAETLISSRACLAVRAAPGTASDPQAAAQ